MKIILTVAKNSMQEKQATVCLAILRRNGDVLGFIDAELFACLKI